MQLTSYKFINDTKKTWDLV